MSSPTYPFVGVGIVVENKNGEILLGKRRGISHGSDTWGLPAGRLALGESVFAGARREVMEETGLALNDPKVIAVVDDIHYLQSDGKHFVTIGISGNAEGIPSVCQMEKCSEWNWFNKNKLPEKIFKPSATILARLEEKILYKEWGLEDAQR